MLHSSIVRGARAVAAIIVAIGTVMMLSCSKDSPTNPAEATWALTVNVVDGYSGSKIANARIDFKTVAAKDTFVTTNAQGQAQLKGLVAGTQNFTVSCVTSSAGLEYTTLLVSMLSVADSSGLKKLADQQKTVTLFPLSCVISGKVVSKLHDMAPRLPVAGLTISAAFSDPDLLTEKNFQVRTDSAGFFQLSKLPMAKGLKITVPNTTIGGADFAPDSFSQPALAASIPLGTITMRPIDAKDFKLMSSVPSTMTPNQTIQLTYSSALDTVSYATFEGLTGAPTVQAVKTVGGAKLSITPSISLVDGSKYCLVVYAFGAAGGTAVSKDTVSVKGGGIIDVVASNVLDANHQAVDGLALSDSMLFKFRAAVVKANASVVKGETVILVDVSFRDSVLIVKPKGSWESGTYEVKISATLSDSTTSTFNFKITTAAGLAFVSSNIYNFSTNTVINGLKIDDTIVVTASKAISSAEATLSLASSSTAVPTTKTISGTTVKIVPTEKLRASTAYAFTITVTTAQKENRSFTIPSTTPFTTASSNFYPLSDNIRTSGDPTKPVLNFRPNGTIIIKMSTAVKSATAQLTGDSNRIVAVEVKVSGDTIRIAPLANLAEGVGYDLKITAESSTGIAFSDANFVSNFYVKNTFLPLKDNVRSSSDPKQPALNFPPAGIIVIVMSDTVQSATAALLNGTAIVGSDVKWNKDTLKIIPHDLLSPAISYDLSLAAKSVTGLTFQAEAAPFFVTGLRVQVNQVRVIKSNVLSSDGLGLTNLPVNTVPYYVLSATPDPKSLAITMFAGDTVKTTVSVSGDTVTVKPVINLAAATQYKVTIKGKTAQSDPIDIDLTGSNKVFATRAAVIVAASNMLDANGKPVSSLLPSTELWVKFSRPLSTDLTKLQLGGTTAGDVVTYKSGATNNNVTVRISGDTLFAKFLPNAQPGDGDSVILRGITVTFDDASTIGSEAVNLKAYILKKPAPYVIATNGLVGNTVVDTFGVQAEAWIVSSMSFRSVDAVKNGLDGFATVGAQNLLLSNVRTHGDTIFFKPAIRLGYGTEYQVAFNVTLADSTKYTGPDLKLRWKTIRGVYLVSANDMATGAAYRPFSLTGDSLVLTFSKAIDTTKTFTIGNFVTRMTHTWNTGKTVVTIKPLDTLKAKTYSPTPGYSLTDHPEYDSIPITLTTLEGEVWTAKPTNVSSIFNNARPALAVHTVPGIEVLNTTLKVSNANRNQYYNNTDNRKLSDLVAANLVVQNDSVGIADTLKVYFSAAVDSGAVARTPAMVRLTQGAATQNISISYSSDHKTVFVKPVNILAVATAYTLTLTDVQGFRMAASDPNGDISYSLAFRTRPAGKKPLCVAAVALAADTAKTAGVLSKRRGYSGSNGEAYNITGGSPSLNPGDVAGDNTIDLMYYELAFRSTLVSDTVSHYQIAVKDSGPNGNGSWHELRTLIPARHYSVTSERDSFRTITLDLSSASVNDTDIYGAKLGPVLRVGAPTGFQNDSNIFNYGKTLQVKMRPVLSANNIWDAADQYLPWPTTALPFQDNVAPCDTDFVANDNNLSRLQTVNRGGVSVTVKTCPMNRATPTALPDSQYIFTFVFPEDMDVATATNKPGIKIWYGAGTPTSALVAETTPAKGTYWDGNAYTYRLTVTVPGGINWTAYAPYFAVSVAGMKDASGQAIQSWGATGEGTITPPANGTPMGSVFGHKPGTVNLMDLTSF